MVALGWAFSERLERPHHPIDQPAAVHPAKTLPPTSVRCSILGLYAKCRRGGLQGGGEEDKPTAGYLPLLRLLIPTAMVARHTESGSYMGLREEK